MVTPAQRLMTAEEFFLLPSEDGRAELIDGVVVRMSPTGYEHGSIANLIAWHLTSHVTLHDLGDVSTGDTGFLLHRNPDLVRAPDVAFVRLERLDLDNLPKKYFPGPPDLAVEVVSPNDGAEDVQRKADDWLHAGTSLVLIVYPGLKRIAVHAPGRPVQLLGEDDVLDLGEAVPGFTMRVADAFPRSRRRSQQDETH